MIFLFRVCCTDDGQQARNTLATYQCVCSSLFSVSFAEYLLFDCSAEQQLKDARNAGAPILLVLSHSLSLSLKCNFIWCTLFNSVDWWSDGSSHSLFNGVFTDHDLCWQVSRVVSSSTYTKRTATIICMSNVQVRTYVQLCNLVCSNRCNNCATFYGNTQWIVCQLGFSVF